MNFIKAMWRLVLFTLFVIGMTYGLSAHATEPESGEKAVHETTEEVKHEVKGEAAEEAQETEAEEETHGEEETHETKEEGKH